METIKLDLIPGKKMPSLHASQYDDGRAHGIDLFENGVVYKLDGTETLTINERKGDDCICSLDIENTFAGSNHIVFASTEQMCAVWGNNICELVIKRESVTLGTLNFILEIEPSPTEGGIESESEISNLERQITEITEQVIGDDYYTAEETDEAIATAIEGKADTTYVDTELDKKADKNNTYTKTQVDNALNDKMDKANPTGTGSFSMHRKSGSTVGQYSHAEGYNCEASGQGSHAEGLMTKSTGHQASHAEGSTTTASGTMSHAEGLSSTASGEVSHAEGSDTIASGMYSHAEGYKTEAGSECQHVFGKYNIIDRNNEFVEVVGNGPVGFWNERSNARTLDWQGNEMLAGDLTFNGNKSLTSEISRLDGKIDNLPAPMIFKGTLGVGGTIQSLPTASASNEGFTYKVITDGTYAGQTAKVGDVFTSNGSAWVLIPSGDEDNDTWRAIKINGVEKLGNGISSGAVDFVGSENIEVEFDSNGNKVGIKTKNIYTKEESDEKYATKMELSAKADVSAIPTKTSQLQNDSGFAQIDDSEESASKTYSSEKIEAGLDTKARIDGVNDYMLGVAEQCNYGTNRNLVNMLTDGYLTATGEPHAQTSSKQRTTGYISVISGHYYNFLYNYSNDGWFRILKYDSNKTFLGVTDQNNVSEYRYMATTEAYIRISFRSYGNDNALSIVDLIPQGLTYTLGVTEYAGYIGSTGVFTRPTVAKEVYTGYYPLVGDLSLNFTVYTKDKSERLLWCCYATYDENFNFISRTTIRSDSQPKLEIFDYALSQSDINTLISGGAKYIAFTYRTYDVITSVISANYKKPFVEQKMSDLLVKKVLNIESLMPDVTRLNIVDVNNNVKSINHRGFNTAPENTLPAFKLSRQNGFAYVETDIRFTSDNVAVLLHDASINRTARNSDGTAISGTVNIADITYAQALEYDFGVYKNASYAGTKIPTLEQFMALCRNIGLHPYLELRNDVNYTAEQYGIVYETVRNSGMLNNVSWISHGKAKLEEVLSRKPNARVGLLTDTLATGNITTVNEIKTSYPNADVFLNADYSTLNSTNLAYAINNETPLEVWTVNTDNAILGLDTYISGVTSDSKVAGNVTYNHDLT